MSDISLNLFFSVVHLFEGQGMVVRLIQPGLLPQEIWAMSNTRVG